MLRNNFRTKLLGIIAVPVAALIGITAFAGYGRLSDARDAGKLRHRVDVIAAGAALAQQVQLEQAASADIVANPGADRAPLVAQRAATDRAAQAYRDAVQNAGDVSSTAFDAALDRVRRNLNALTTSYRGAVDLGSDINSVTYAFSEIGASVSDLIGTVADESSDPSLSREASALAALSHGKDATAKEWAVLEVSLSRGAFKDAEEGTFRGAVTDRDRWLGIHDGLATSASRSALQVRMSGPAITVSDSIERNALATTGFASLLPAPTANQPATSTVAQWHDSMATRLDVLDQVLKGDITNLATHASVVERGASQDLRTFLLVAAAAVLMSAGLGLVLARTVTTPLRQLKDAAERLADEQLPALVNGLRHPGQDDERYLATTLTPIEVTSGDEIGQLARAFNSVQTVAVDVAAEQASLLRKGISEIFVNLARRNQVLIDRQIEFLDELEATEDDPDQLAQLYRLDHLATRMRRNAESLLVLAGIEPARTRSRPVPLFDVVRAAIGEVEDFSRIDLTAFDDVDVIGNAAVDLGHLLAELMDNAAHFSPPDTRVRIEGRHGRAGYVISVVDAGIGMTEEQLVEANDLLSSPPPVGLALSRSLGFTVVARLAARYGVSVRLLPGDPGGTAAIVHVPQHVIATDEPDEAWAPQTPAAEERAVAAAAAARDHDGQTVGGNEAKRTDAGLPERGAAPAPTEPAAPVARAWEAAVAGDAADTADVTAQDAAADPATHERPEDEFESVISGAWGDEPPIDDVLDGAERDHEGAPYDHGTVESPDDDHRADDDAGADPDEDDPARSISAWVDPFGEGADAVADDLGLTPEPTSPAPGAPATLRDAVPQGPSFDQGLAALVDGSPSLGAPQLIEPPVPDPVASIDATPDDIASDGGVGEPDPVDGDATNIEVAEPVMELRDEPAPTEPVSEDDGHDADVPVLPDRTTTASGLTRRVRKPGHGVDGLDRYHTAPSGPSILATKRSPEDVKAMLARYRTGLHRGRAGDELDDPETGSK